MSVSWSIPFLPDRGPAALLLLRAAFDGDVPSPTAIMTAHNSAASEMRRMLAARGLTVSTGKMSGLWPGSPTSVKLDELDAICAVLGCGIEELLLPEPGKAAAPEGGQVAATAAGRPAVTPRYRDGRTLPPP